MSKIKIKDKVRVKKDISDHSDFWSNCSCAIHGFDYLEITGLPERHGYFKWRAFNKDGKQVDFCSRHNLTEDDLIPYERTIEEVREDDLITDGTYFRRVLGRAGRAVVLTFTWKEGKKEEVFAGGFFSIQELKYRNYTIVKDIPELSDEEKAIKLLEERGRIKAGKIIN